jgi:hypothetical protein
MRVAQGDFRDGFFRRWVDDGASLLPGGQHPLAADEDAIQTARSGEPLDEAGGHRSQRRLPWQTYFRLR